MTRSRGRVGKHTGGPVARLAVIGAAFLALSVATPLMSATADPKPSLKELSSQVEKLHEQIGTLAEQYNGERVRLTQAKRAADLAQKTLSTSESDLAAKRHKAGLLAQNAYMTGGLGSALAFTGSPDPDAYLDRAATTYALEQRQGEEVAQVTRAMRTAERARASAKARSTEVTRLVAEIGAKRDKISKLVERTESDLFREAMRRSGASAGRRVRIDVPIVGSGKAAQATRYALTQQLKPYIWGAEGPRGFDCSGLVMWAYQKVGISLPHYTGDQWTAGTHISREEMRPGDLVFFYRDLHHVGIYIGGGMMVHAPQTGDVVHIAPIGNRPFAGAVRIAD
ncbi:NlpC/P60 family protein [Spongiactinospora sp. TRM90649]|uniref:C40 family peptidase n=1 Tax=Spongiactinospora sp. TRM90649 TaxID=3031114 RepID=UPI0023F6CBB8|nr:NlpC/P60 family protein [Spongiactinospora sp. TRM90649]MDF5758934.1 NlpC/P60 family protein [Spongiactinospora sp. TRM90649]